MRKEWDIFDILFAHEDSYTNLLQYLFENSKEFYRNFSELLFGKNIENLQFITRTAYDTEKGKRNIPDIIIYNADNFAMVEVKVDSGEGKNQTKNYYECKDTIKKKLGVSANSIERFYFLTLLGTKAKCDKFISLSWLKIGECLPKGKCETEEMKLLVNHLKRRIDSLMPKTIQESDKWCDVVKTEYWGGARGLFDALKNVPAFKKLPDEMCDYWGSFKKAKNRFTYSALFLMDTSWKGCDVTAINNQPNNCYEYHYEFEWDEISQVFEMRLDYHLNPYMSKADIKAIEYDEEITDKDLALIIKEFAEKANCCRQEIAKQGKNFWTKYAPEDWKNCYNTHITENVLKLASKNIEISEDVTVAQIVKQIDNFVKSTSKFVDEIMLPLQNKEISISANS